MQDARTSAPRSKLAEQLGMAVKMRKTAPNGRVTPQLMLQNGILQGLDAPIVSTIVGQGTLLDLALHQTIYKPEEAIKDVYFPVGCVLSVVTR